MKLLLFSLLAASPTALTAQDDSPVVRGEVGARLDEYLTRLEGVGFAGVVGVLEEGEPCLLAGYGLADREAGLPVTTETVFSVGSITKQFTATAILVLEQRGKLSVEDTLAAYFDDVPADKAGITLHHLLTHTSGLPGGFGGDWDLEATDEWLLARALESRLSWPPGGGYQYSNAGYSLLGMVVERVSGRGYEEFLRTELFEPAGMRSTGYSGFAAGRIAVGYDRGRRWGTVLGRPMLSDGPCWNLRANGGIHSTVGDMLRWHRALEGEAILSAASKAKMFTPHVDGGRSFYGYGWSVHDVPGEPKLISHNGGNGILFADFLRYPDDDVAIFMATSLAQDFGPMTRPVRAVVLGQDYELPPATLTCDEALVARYVGRYPLDDESTFELVHRGGRFVLVGHGAGAAEILGGGDEASELRELTTEIAAGLMEGDATAFFEWSAVGASRRQQEERIEKVHRVLVAAHGQFVGLGAAVARVDGSGARSFVELRLEEGAVYLLLSWRDGRIGDLDVSAEPPWPPGGELELFPFAPTEFGTFSMREPVSRSIRFELDADGRAVALELDSALGPIQAYRD